MNPADLRKLEAAADAEVAEARAVLERKVMRLEIIRELLHGPNGSTNGSHAAKLLESGHWMLKAAAQEALDRLDVFTKADLVAEIARANPGREFSERSLDRFLKQWRAEGKIKLVQAAFKSAGAVYKNLSKPDAGTNAKPQHELFAPRQ